MQNKNVNDLAQFYAILPGTSTQQSLSSCITIELVLVNYIHERGNQFDYEIMVTKYKKL